MNWETTAKLVYETYNAFVDWEERFFVCPECGEPIYEDDWNDYDYGWEQCPVCDFEW